MKKLLTLLLLTTPACAETFTSNVVLQKETSSPNIEFFECDGCADTYGLTVWKGSDGVRNFMLGAHEYKGSVNPPDLHNHFMERWACGSDPSDIRNCGRIDTNFNSDHPLRRISRMDVLYDDSFIFLESPDGNRWKILVDNQGNLTAIDESPQSQPVINP